MKRIIVKHNHKIIISTTGDNEKICMFATVFCVANTTIMDDEIVLHVVEPK
jgi:hypothetical protein